MSFWQVAADRLHVFTPALAVGARCEPVADAFAGSSVEIVTGGDQVPLLADYLTKR